MNGKKKKEKKNKNKIRKKSAKEKREQQLTRKKEILTMIEATLHVPTEHWIRVHNHVVPQHRQSFK